MSEADELKYKIKLVLARIEVLFAVCTRSKQFRSDTDAHRRIKAIEKMLKEAIGGEGESK